jgi:hypothetical protein
LQTDIKDGSDGARYHHISVEKLAVAFEKQFMMGLPEFGHYTKDDLKLSPKAMQAKLEKFGLDKKHLKSRKGSQEPLVQDDQDSQYEGNMPTFKDLAQASIFQSKNEFYKLKKRIDDNEMAVKVINYILLYGLGIIPACFALIDMVVPTPFAVNISLRMTQYDQTIEILKKENSQ